MENDIAVLKLASSVSLYDYPNIKPACLPTANAKFPGPATVSGWGTVAYNSHLNSWLHEVSVTVFDDGNCGNYTENEITDERNRTEPILLDRVDCPQRHRRFSPNSVVARREGRSTMRR